MVCPDATSSAATTAAVRLLPSWASGRLGAVWHCTCTPRQGASPFGVVGNVWQFTDEFQDEHTRAVLTRRGSHYYPVVDAASHWYFPNGADMRKLTGPHGKYMLMSDSYDRAGTIGFRCAAD